MDRTIDLFSGDARVGDSGAPVVKGNGKVGGIVDAIGNHQIGVIPAETIQRDIDQLKEERGAKKFWHLF